MGESIWTWLHMACYSMDRKCQSLYSIPLIPTHRNISIAGKQASSAVGIPLHVFVPTQTNVAPNTVMASRHKKTQLRTAKQSKPVYLHSQD